MSLDHSAELEKFAKDTGLPYFLPHPFLEYLRSKQVHGKLPFVRHRSDSSFLYLDERDESERLVKRVRVLHDPRNQPPYYGIDYQEWDYFQPSRIVQLLTDLPQNPLNFWYSFGKVIWGNGELSEWIKASIFGDGGRTAEITLPTKDGKGSIRYLQQRYENSRVDPRGYIHKTGILNPLDQVYLYDNPEPLTPEDDFLMIGRGRTIDTSEGFRRPGIQRSFGGFSTDITTPKARLLGAENPQSFIVDLSQFGLTNVTFPRQMGLPYEISREIKLLNPSS